VVGCGTVVCGAAGAALLGSGTAAVGICGAGAMCGAEDSMVPSSDSAAAGACGAAAVVWVSGEPHEAQNLAPSMVG
ncbi:MAG: hypothetical protein WAX76_05640, partial [Bifidobacterium adolescentis]